MDGNNMNGNYEYETTYEVEPATGGNGMAIASLVCGILSVTVCVASGIPQILSIIFGIMALKQGQKKAMSIWGIVLGSIGTIICIILCIIFFFIGFLAGWLGL